MDNDVEFKLLKEINCIDCENDYIIISLNEPQLIIKKELPYGLFRVFLHKLAIPRYDEDTNTSINIYDYNDLEAIGVINQCIVNCKIYPVVSFNFKLHNSVTIDMITDLYVEYDYNDNETKLSSIYPLNVYDFITRSFSKIIFDDKFMFKQNTTGKKSLLFYVLFANNTMQQIDILNTLECEHTLSIPSIINSVKMDAYDEMIHPEYIEERYNIIDDEILSFEDDEYTFNDSEPEDDYDVLKIDDDN